MPDAEPASAADSAPPPAPRRLASGGPLVEALLALLVGVLLAALSRRPQDLASTVPGDPRDPLLLSWALAWPAHALSERKSLWDANIFAPLDNTAAFTDLLLGYLPFGLIGDGPEAALLRYNVVLLLASALAFAGVYVLVRQLGLGRAAALVAATAFAFNPWRVSQLNHLQVLSSGGIPLALAMLARGHGIGRGGRSRSVRPGWAVAGWLVAAWQLTLGFGIGLQLAYLLGVCAVVVGLRAVLQGLWRSRWPRRSIVVADALGIAVFVAVGALLAQPYFAAVDAHPEARRPVSEVAFYSPAASALITAPAQSLVWGRYSEPLRAGVYGINEKALFPGAVSAGLAAVGLLPGAWSTRRRLGLAAVVTALVLLALGTSGPGSGRWAYLLLYEHAPGWQGVRTPSRLVTTAWLGLALLAANGMAVLLRFAARVSRAPAVDPAVTLGIAAAVCGLAFLEGLDTAPQTPAPVLPGLTLSALPAPVLVLPSEDHVDQNVMLWSTDGFPRVANGVSGFTPAQQAALRGAAARLPAADAVAALRRSGVATVVVVPAWLPGTRYAALDPALLADVPGVEVERRGDTFVIDLQVSS